MPPTGLNFGDFVEDFEMMDGRNSILDLANAPPLFQDQVEMDVMPSGEKRKTTPPDLLTLSNMYFERKQVVRIEPNVLYLGTYYFHFTIVGQNPEKLVQSRGKHGFLAFEAT